MKSTRYFARVMTSLAMLCIVPAAFSQPKDNAIPLGTTNAKSLTTSQCPVMGAITAPSNRNTAAGAYSNGDWWPNQLNFKSLP